MLLFGDYKISEVQDMCGFENASYFTALFRKVTGVTPSEFSKNKDYYHNDFGVFY